MTGGASVGTGEVQFRGILHRSGIVARTTSHNEYTHGEE